MNLEEYLEKVQSNFQQKTDVVVGKYTAQRFYEEQFKAKWIATKLKIYSFVSHLPNITEDDIMNYSNQCLSHALKNYKGLPRGIQNGVVSFNVLVSEHASPEAIAYAQKRPKKHFSAMEMPVIYDLSTNKIYYYEKTPMWGAIYYSYFREYIESSFNVR